jgi:pimeloyl-ACP methyl ester carboxylesterase
LVQPEIAKTNRVCSYDRAGSGWSDPDTEGSRGDVALDLHTTLQAAGEKPPYVMVGASMGGIYVRLYQDRYPDEVVGMVLVDPSHEDRLFTMFEGKGVTIASLTAEQYRSVFRPGSIRVPPRSPQTGAPFDRLPRELYELRIALDRRLIASIPLLLTYDTVTASGERERARLARLREIGLKDDHPLGDRPLVVLTRGVESSQGLRDVHAVAARLSTNSRHTVVAGAGHEIHLFEPPVVIQAILDVAVAARDKTRLPAR